MKKVSFTLIILLTAIFCSAQISFKSGSIEFDRDLNKINADAKIDIGKFNTQLKIGYNISEKKLTYMSAKLNMEPAEKYLALEISKNSGTPIDEVLNIYQANKSKGWGYIAKQAGIKPGSPAFHAMKNSAKGKAKKNKGNKGKKGNKGGKGKKGKK